MFVLFKMMLRRVYVVRGIVRSDGVKYRVWGIYCTGTAGWLVRYYRTTFLEKRSQ